MLELLLAERDIVLLSEGAHDSQTLVLVERHRPDVLLVETLRFDRALSLVRSISTLSGGTKTLLICSRPDDAMVARFLGFGGSGCVDLVNERELTHAIRAVHGGELWAPRRIISSALRDALKPIERASRRDALQKQLSKRECEIVEWMRCGMTNKEIARKLGISDMTVKTHLHNIFSKLEVSGRVRLLGLAHVERALAPYPKAEVNRSVASLPDESAHDLKPAA
jgi:NarL family two-component system response regulator LiaR